MSGVKFVLLFVIFVSTRKPNCLAEIQFIGGHSLVPNDTKFMSYDNLKIEKVNQTGYFLSGSIELFVDIGNDYEVYSMLSKKGAGNAYDYLVFEVGPEKFCEHMQGKDDDDYGGACEIPKKGVCPWPKGKFNCNGYRSTLNTFPEISRGDYMLEIRYLQAGKVLNGIQYFFKIVKD